MVLKGASNINAFSNLVFAVGRMKKLNQTYSNFPEDPAKFAKWRDKVRSEMEEVKQKFIPNPI